MSDTSTRLIPAAINFLKPIALRIRSATSVIANEPTYSAAAFRPLSEDEIPFCSSRMDNTGSSKPWLRPAAIITVIRMK
ncbi:hypothetical protein D3C85_1574650 [compost metagenome]